MFGNGGHTVAPRLVLRVEARDGSVIWRAPEAKPAKVLDDRVAFLVTDVLRQALERGSGAAVRRVGFNGPAAGKTGTTNEGTDGWFVGYLPDLVMAVWVGFDHPRSIGSQATGATLAAPAWARITKQWYTKQPMPPAWVAPAGVVVHPIDEVTGRRLAHSCTTRASKHEYFIAGSEPPAQCPGDESWRPHVLGSRTIAFNGEGSGADPVAAIVPTPSTAARIARPVPSATPMVSAEPPAVASDAPALRDDTLTGEWQLTTRIRQSSYDAYHGLELGYRVHLWHEGERVRGDGEKVAEDGRALPRARRRRIRFEGRINGTLLRLSFFEEGHRRTSGGVMHLRLSGANRLRGVFSSSAAASSGTVAAQRGS